MIIHATKGSVPTTHDRAVRAGAAGLSVRCRTLYLLVAGGVEGPAASDGSVGRTSEERHGL
jgi:hypothetical protein